MVKNKSYLIVFPNSLLKNMKKKNKFIAYN
jgi:hypothetical protein